MSLVYFDSSALVKLVIEEDGSDIAAALWDGCDAALCSRIGYPEVRAALAAAQRNHRLDEASGRAAGDAFENYWAAVRPIELTTTVAVHAGELSATHALPSADVIHLASALVLGQDHLVFAGWDVRLREGAAAAGLHVAPAHPS